MPPRIRLNADEALRLPALLDLVDALRCQFPKDADAATQVCWVQDRYSSDSPLTLNLITLLLFEHGVHRSVDQVARDLAILRKDSKTNNNE
jgi:hypothetical protein